MFARAWYALLETWRQRTQLRCFITDPGLQLKKVIALQPHTLMEHQVQGLILDFDGVLASHAESVPRPEVVLWLKDFAPQYAPNQIYILSNKPTKERIEYFKQNFPHIGFIVAARKKPYPDGLLQIVALSGLDPHKLLLVDDRLMTGMLAAILAGVQGCLITDPYQRLQRRPIRETFFFILRHLERGFIRGIT